MQRTSEHSSPERGKKRETEADGLTAHPPDEPEILLVETIKRSLREANFLAPEGDPRRDEFIGLHSLWHDKIHHDYESWPFFLFGFHNGFWYMLEPLEDNQETCFDAYSIDFNDDANEYPKINYDNKEVHIECEAYCGIRSIYRNEKPHSFAETSFGFNCPYLGSLRWTKGSLDTSEEELLRNKWVSTYAKIEVYVEILEDGSAGPIWALPTDSFGYPWEPGQGDEVDSPLGDDLTKIGNSIENMGKQEWSVFQPVPYERYDYDLYPLYQSKENGRLKYLTHPDEEMEPDSEDDEPKLVGAESKDTRALMDQNARAGPEGGDERETQPVAARAEVARDAAQDRTDISIWMSLLLLLLLPLLTLLLALPLLLVLILVLVLGLSVLLLLFLPLCLPLSVLLLAQDIFTLV